MLHTWGSALTHHPHVHMIVPGGGLSPDGQALDRVPAAASSCPCACSRALFRRLFLETLAAAHAAGRLQFFGDHARLADAHAFAAYLAPLRKIEWVVYAKRPFGGPEAVLRLSVALHPPRRHLQQPADRPLDENGVTFKWKDYRIEGPRPIQDDDAGDRRVHPPLPDPRPARRLPPHPPLRAARQHHPRRTTSRTPANCSPCRHAQNEPDTPKQRSMSRAC